MELASSNQSPNFDIVFVLISTFIKQPPALIDQILSLPGCLLTTEFLTKSTGTSNRVLISHGGTQAEVQKIGAELGLRFRRKVLSRYEFVLPPSVRFEELRDSHPELTVEKLTYQRRVKKAVAVSDAQWSNQWHLQTSQTPSMNVYNAWDKGFNGSGITIAIVDDGIDVDHSDLLSNYNSTLSYDVIYDSLDPSHVYAGEGHGTNCAGVAGAAKNTDCVIGVAYDASLPAIRLLDEVIAATEADEALALTHELSNIDIYSNSWGPVDDGESFSGMASVQEEALQTGVTQGRGGLGAIYTWASGNGGDVYDDCNADGYTSSIYTIAIAAMSETTAPTWYSEHCTAILAAAYSGDSPNAQITTTGPSDTCVNDFSGTSSAAPVASGICALTLQAKDMQHMIVEYSITTGLHSNASFYTNGAGYQVSHWFGFGLMDAEAMVDNAPSWLTVPSSTSCSSTQIDVYNSTVGGNITSTYNATRCYISYLEHVIVTISYEASFRGDVEFYLDSPAGTQSILFRSRIFDASSSKTTWDFMSVHNWGEDPEGEWTLTMSDVYGGTSMDLYSWSIQFYGTLTDPLAGTPAAGALGGSCSNSTDCSTLTDGGCLEDGGFCVVCNNGYHVLDIFCKQDGWLGGYCDDVTPCVTSSLECVSNICEEKQTDDERSNIALFIGIACVALLATVGFIVCKLIFASKASANVAPAPNAGGPPANYSQQRAPQVSETPYNTSFQPTAYSGSLPPLHSGPEPVLCSNPAV